MKREHLSRDGTTITTFVLDVELVRTDWNSLAKFTLANRNMKIIVMLGDEPISGLTVRMPIDAGRFELPFRDIERMLRFQDRLATLIIEE